MAFVFFNPNPLRKRVDDCTVRAMCAALGISWEKAYMDLCTKGLTMADMPNANSVWGSYLRDNGFVRKSIPDTCPDCYRIVDFCNDHPEGLFVAGAGTHVLTVIDGQYMDSWDSGDEVLVNFWHKEGS